MDGEPSDESDESADELLPARPLRIRRWWAAAGVAAVLVAGSIQFVQHGRVEVVQGSGRPATTQHRVLDQQASLSSVVGNRCPTSVVCGVSATVTPGMSAAFRHDFPGATVSMQARAFDAGEPITYWQQISATTPADTVVVLTQQRISVKSHRPSTPTVRTSADGSTATVTAARGGWLLIANLLGDNAATLPVGAARHWVAATALPR